MDGGNERKQKKRKKERKREWGEKK
jgi:hypothetical protein